MPACPVNQTSFPLAITVSIPRGGVVLNVMERARDINPEFAFSATYFGVTYGYFIDTIGETTNNDICAWTFLYEPPGYDLYIPTVGVSNFVLPVNAGTGIHDFRSDRKGYTTTNNSYHTNRRFSSTRTRGHCYHQWRGIQAAFRDHFGCGDLHHDSHVAVLK